ncbi:MAG: hypothetical protein IJT72_09440 [Lachnospiraceae bacterium]|nr:hypothetical protein [Lachnospiraceae bacterium]
MRKFFGKAVIISSLFVFALTGCSSKKNDEKTTASETEAVTEAVTEEVTEETTEENASDSDASGKVADSSEMTTVDEVVEEGMVPVTADMIKDGEYDVVVSSSSTMFNIESCKLTVADGKMTAVMTMGGKGYLYIYPGTGEEAVEADEADYIPFVEDEDGAHTFEISVDALDEGVPCAAFSKKKEKWYDRTILFRADSLPMDAYKDGVFTTAKSLGLEDGTYTAEVTMTGGSGRAIIDSPATIVVSNGECTASIVWSSPNYDYMIVNDEKYLPVNTEGNSVFEIPLTMFDRNMTVIADTVAMSEPYEIEYKFNFDSSTIEKIEE